MEAATLAAAVAASRELIKLISAMSEDGTVPPEVRDKAKADRKAMLAEWAAVTTEED